MKNYAAQKILGLSELEILFLKQIEKLEKLSFSQKILDALIAKKDAVLESVKNCVIKEGAVPFLPVIPVGVMDSIDQVIYHNGFKNCGVHREYIYSVCNGFHYNEDLGVDYVKSMSDPYYLINVTVVPLETIPVPTEENKLNHVGRTARAFFEKKGLSTLNHTESLSVACHSDLRGEDKGLCAFSFDWEGFEFAGIYHNRDTYKNVFSWITPLIEEGNKFLMKPSVKNKEILVGLCEKRI